MLQPQREAVDSDDSEATPHAGRLLHPASEKQELNIFIVGLGAYDDSRPVWR